MTLAGEVVKCRYCGASMKWITNENGKLIPVDAREHPIYLLNFEGGYNRADKGTAFITHFATCSGASQASADAKARRQTAGGAP